MTVVRILDDGWLALPGAFRRTLGLGTNAMLEAELVDGTIGHHRTPPCDCDQGQEPG